MKTRINRFETILRICVVFVSFLIVTSCKTTKDISKERVKEQIQSAVMENIKTTAETGTTSDTKTTAETTVTESFDTVVRVMPVVDGVVADKPIFVPVKGTRTIHRKEVSYQRQNSQEKGTEEVNRIVQILKKSDNQKMEKHFKGTVFPGWLVVIIIVVFGLVFWFGWNKVF
jgi:hypothetical protein